MGAELKVSLQDLLTLVCFKVTALILANRPRVGTELFLAINWTDLWWVCRAHYNVRMLNIAVNGVNVTTPSAFEITATGGGVIFDSGTTLSYLTQPAYGKFLTAVCIYPCRCLC